MRRYSFQNTTLIVSREGSADHLVVGWADGDDVIQIKRRAPSMIDTIGASGEMMVSCSADCSGEITFRLQQTSPSNAHLLGLLHKQENEKTFSPIRITFTDAYRQDSASCAQACYIKKMPDLIRGVKANSMEWTIVVENLQILLGS